MARFYFSPHFAELVRSLPSFRESLGRDEVEWVEMMNRRDVELEDYLNALGAFRIFRTGNTAGGDGALPERTNTGSENTAIGYGVLANNVGGSGNTGMGAGALAENTEGVGNTAIGYGVLQDNVAGAGNTGVGAGALADNTEGVANTAMGVGGLAAATTGIGNTGAGYLAGHSTTTGSRNTDVGILAGGGVTTGDRNTAVGSNAGWGATTEQGTIAIGADATATGDWAIAIGSGTVPGSDPAQALGAGSVAIGTDSTGLGAAAVDDNEFVLGTARHTVHIPGELAGYVPDALHWMDSPRPGEAGVAGPTGATGAPGAPGAPGVAEDSALFWMSGPGAAVVTPASVAASGGTPTFVASGDTYTVPVNTQVLYALEIDVEGILDIEGALVEVD